MVTHSLALETHALGQLAHLERVPCREHDFMPALLQLANDGLEERHVRRVIEIDPNFHKLLSLLRRQRIEVIRTGGQTSSRSIRARAIDWRNPLFSFNPAPDEKTAESAAFPS
jgi:hypothetical protein